MSKAGSGMLEGARQALAYASGEADVADYGIHIPEKVDVKAIRKRQNLSQKVFAARFGLSVGRLHDWEQRRSEVDPSSRVLLTVIDRELAAVERALQRH
ncbi:UNVERIFIED_ORG: putative transcriptional regulator [Martelella mediterranea]